MDIYKKIEGLEPKAVLKCFCDLSMIPRVPGKQRQVSDFLADYVRRLGLPVTQDSHLNVIARKPASPGYESAPSIMVQAHMDMVCEKNPGVVHDFGKESLKLRLEGDKLTAEGTTLGADDGIGVAFIMALLADKDIKHPAIEAVFTTDEETDMGGAFSLDYSQFKSRTVINLDSFAVSICGSGELEVEMRFEKRAEPIKSDSLLYTIRIGGLMGGHSGKNAMAERGNAIVLLNRILMSLDKKICYQLISMQGGAGMSSAFARNSECTIAFSPADLNKVEAVITQYFDIYKQELKKRDPGVTVEISPCVDNFVEAIDAKTADTLKKLLCILPDGVFSLNKDFPGLMESCTNVGVVETREKDLFVTTLIRSFIASKKYYLYDKVTMICDTLGVSYSIGRDLPHWDYNIDERIIKLLKEVYPDLEFSVSEGTLETGIFCANLPKASVIALGSPYYNAHSPNEYLLISETELYWKRLLEMLEKFK